MDSLTQPVYRWPEKYRHFAIEGDVLNAGISLLAAGDGFKALWCDGNTKRPLTRNGVHDATDNAAEFYQASETLPDNVEPAIGAVTPPGLAFMDIDHKQIEVPGLPRALYAGESTERGLHLCVGFHMAGLDYVSRHSWGEVRAGDSGYTIIAPSKGKRVHYPQWNWRFLRDWLPLPEHGSVSVNHLRAGFIGDYADTTTAEVTEADVRQANTITTNLLKGKYGYTVGRILRGEIEGRYLSRSEADFALLLMATHFEATEGCLHELLRRHSRKLAEKSFTAQMSYANSVVAGAIRTRQHKNRVRLISIAQTLNLPTIPISPSPPPPPHKVYVMPKNGNGVIEGMEGMRKKEQRGLMIESILGWAGMAGCGDSYDRAYGFRRLPVSDFGDIFGYHRDGVRRVVLGLVEAGLIERDTPLHTSDRGDRRDCLIRLRTN